MRPPRSEEKGTKLNVTDGQKGSTVKVIDSYCEFIAEKSYSDEIVVVAEDEETEAFLNRMDVLIKEMYAELTAYSEAEFRCGKALLQLIKKYCMSKKAMGNLQMAKDFSEYFVKTDKILDHEIQKIPPDAQCDAPVIDAETVFTIISNAMQMLTSVIQMQKREKEKTNAQFLGIALPIKVDKQEAVSLARESTTVEDIVPYLDAVFCITENFEKAKKNPGSNKTPIVEWAEFHYLKQVLTLTKSKLDEIGVF